MGCAMTEMTDSCNKKESPKRKKNPEDQDSHGRRRL